MKLEPVNARRLRWGILGCARISRRGLIPGILESSQGDLFVLGSRNAQTARQWAEEFGIPKSVGSYEEVICDPEVDAVYIPLPNELHKEWVYAAADAGKHVLCEKPLALDVGEAKAMAAHCRTRGVRLVEAFMWRHQPRVAGLRDLVAQRRIGDLRLIRSSFSFTIDPGDWRLDPARGGGALWDVGCYGVSTARLFAGGEPDVIRSVARMGPTGVDLSLTAVMQFPSGVLAQVDCSFEQPFRCTYELVGTEGTLEVPDAYLPPERPIALLKTSAGTEELAFAGGNQYAAMVDDFARLVQSPDISESLAEDGVAQMETLVAILEASKVR